MHMHAAILSLLGVEAYVLFGTHNQGLHKSTLGLRPFKAGKSLL